MYLYYLTDPQDIQQWWNEYRSLSNEVYDRFLVTNLGMNTYVKKRETKTKYTHIFLTINPPPAMSLMDFHKDVERTLNKAGKPKTWIDGYLYVLEQRGETDNEIGKGFHTHILIKLRDHKKKSEIDRELKNVWKTKLDVDNYHIFNIKYIDDDEQKRKQSYMLCQKAEQIKHLKQSYDIIWRQNNCLQQYYFVDYKIEVLCQENTQDP